MKSILESLLLMYSNEKNVLIDGFGKSDERVKQLHLGPEVKEGFPSFSCIDRRVIQLLGGFGRLSHGPLTIFVVDIFYSVNSLMMQGW
jgi:hypothetical protein